MSTPDGYLLLDATGASDTKIITQSTDVSIQLIVDNTGTSAAEGSLEIQASNTGEHWVNVPYYDTNDVKRTSVPVTDGYDVNVLLDSMDLSSKYIRVYYTKVSGAGSCEFWICIKPRR